MPDWFMEAFPDSQTGPNRWVIPASRWSKDLLWSVASHLVENFSADWMQADFNPMDLTVAITIGDRPVAEPAIP